MAQPRVCVLSSRHFVIRSALFCLVFRKSSVVYFLSTTSARTCIAALCMCFIRPCPCVVAHVFAAKLEWCHVPVRSGDVSTASSRQFQSSVRAALLQLSSGSMTIVFLAEQTTSCSSKIRPLVLLQVPWSLAFAWILSVQVRSQEEIAVRSNSLHSGQLFMWGTLRFTFIGSLSVLFKYH